MVDKTILVVPGRKMSVPRPFKRTLQVLAAVGLTAAVALVIVLGNAFLVSKGGSLSGIDVWLAFIKRSDILATMALTAFVSVMFVYWQRDQERK